MLNKNCKICKQNFVVSSYRKNTAKYCSFKCRIKGQKGKHVSPKTEFKKGQKFSKARNRKISETHQKNHKLRKRVILICQFCKKEFEVIPTYKNRKLCSKKCKKSQKKLNEKKFRDRVAKEFWFMIK